MEKETYENLQSLIKDIDAKIKERNDHICKLLEELDKTESELNYLKLALDAIYPLVEQKEKSVHISGKTIAQFLNH